MKMLFVNVTENSDNTSPSSCIIFYWIFFLVSLVI